MRMSPLPPPPPLPPPSPPPEQSLEDSPLPCSCYRTPGGQTNTTGEYTLNKLILPHLLTLLAPFFFSWDKNIYLYRKISKIGLAFSRKYFFPFIETSHIFVTVLRKLIFKKFVIQTLICVCYLLKTLVGIKIEKTYFLSNFFLFSRKSAKKHIKEHLHCYSSFYPITSSFCFNDKEWKKFSFLYGFEEIL